MPRRSVHVRDLGRLLTVTFENWMRHKSLRQGAALAYYSALSLAPALILLIAVASKILGEKASEYQLYFALRDAMGPTAAHALQALIESAHRSAGGAAAVTGSVAAVLIGLAAVFSEVRDALNFIWDHVVPDAPLWTEIRRWLVTVLLILAAWFVILLSLGIAVGLAAFASWVHFEIPAPPLALAAANILLSTSLIALVFAAIYKIVPDVCIDWRDVWVGAIVTAILFTLGRSILSWYLSRSIGSIYGSAGSPLLVLAWVYYSAQIFLFGAEFTRAFAQRGESRGRPVTREASQRS